MLLPSLSGLSIGHAQSDRFTKTLKMDFWLTSSVHVGTVELQEEGRTFWPTNCVSCESFSRENISLTRVKTQIELES
jgi:hypothetical protein